MGVVCRSGLSIFTERRDGLVRLFAVDGDVAGPLQIAPVDLDIASEKHAGTALGPAPIEPHMAGRRPVEGIAQTFGHGAFGDTVLQRGAARQCQRR